MSQSKREILIEKMKDWLERFGCPDSYLDHTARSMVDDILSVFDQLEEEEKDLNMGDTPV